LFITDLDKFWLHISEFRLIFISVADAFRGHGLSRFVARILAPAGSSARAVPAGVAATFSSVKLYKLD
jgi:hypothetical protein